MVNWSVISTICVFAVFAASTAYAAESDGRMDVAPFGALVTSDPHRTTGARAGRVEEYRAEDVYLEWPAALAEHGTLASGRDGVRCIGLNWLERRSPAEV